MKILHLVNSMAAGNGITNVVVDLATTQKAIGDEAIVGSHEGVYSSFLQQRGVDFFEIDFRARRVGSLLKALWNLRSLIRLTRPDIIHVHTITPLILCRALLVRVPIVATVHNEWQRSSNLMRWATLSVGVSEPVSRSMIQRGIPAARMRTVPNGTTGSLRRPRNVRPAEMRHPAVLFVGQLSRRKGTDVLLQAFAEVVKAVPDAQLYLVGNNDLPVTSLMLGELGLLDSVHVVGLADPFPYYAGADLFVLPSRTEPAALAILEAMEAGVPVVGTRVGGIATFLEGEGGGLAVTSEDQHELSGAIVDVLTNADLRGMLSGRARKVAAVHSVQSVCDGYRRVYEEALGWRQ